MLHKTKHGAYLELVGRPKSWCKLAVASVQWSTPRLCEWKVTGSLSRAALPPHKGWKLQGVSLPRQRSEAGLGSGPVVDEPVGGGWASANMTQKRAEWEESTRASGLLASGLPCQQAPSALWPKWWRERARHSSWIRGGRCSKGGISCRRPSPGAALKCHLRDLDKVQTQTGVQFVINSNKMLRFAPNSSRISKQGKH